MIIRNLRSDNHNTLIEIIKKSDCELRQLRLGVIGSARRSIDGYKLVFKLRQSDYNKILLSASEYESILLNAVANLGFNDRIFTVKFVVMLEYAIDWIALPPEVDKTYILEMLEWEKNVLIEVGTGTPIDEYNDDYKKCHKEMTQTLKDICLIHINNFSDLRSWHKYYKKNLSSYADRRAYIIELYDPLIKTIEDSEETDNRLIEYTPTGWTKIDHAVLLMRNERDRAESEVEYQAIGVHGRELILTLAQMVYDEEKHKHPDGNPINSAQSKRMFEAYISSRSKTMSNEKIKFAKASIDLANNLTHKRTATRLDSELCYIAVISTIHVIYNISQIDKNV